MVLVCSSKGSVCGVTSRTTSVTREPCTFTGTSSETASARKRPAGCSVFAAVLFNLFVSVAELVTSSVSFVSGAMVVPAVGRLPQVSEISCRYMHFWRSYHRRQWDFGTNGELFRHLWVEEEFLSQRAGAGRFLY